MLALTAATGKIGGAVLDALLDYGLVPADQLKVLTSSPPESPKVQKLVERGLKVHHARYQDGPAFGEALGRGDTLFLVSTPEIELDFNDAPLGNGREGRHFSAIEAAVAAGVDRIVYTSLAFKDGSQAGVMRAHFRTESYLRDLHSQGKLRSYTIVREGLYSESWPLYLGHYRGDDDDDERKDVVVAGDGPISWTSIADLGLATALILTEAADRFREETVFLSQQRALPLGHIAATLGCSLKTTSPDEYVQHYVQTRGMDRAMLEWWVSTYPSLPDGLCHIQESPLEELLSSKGRTPQSFEDIFGKMRSKQA